MFFGGEYFGTIDLGRYDKSDQTLSLRDHFQGEPGQQFINIVLVLILVQVVFDLLEMSTKVLGEDNASAKDLVIASDDHGDSTGAILVQVRFLVMLPGECVHILELGGDFADAQCCDDGARVGIEVVAEDQHTAGLGETHTTYRGAATLTLATRTTHLLFKSFYIINN